MEQEKTRVLRHAQWALVPALACVLGAGLAHAGEPTPAEWLRAVPAATQATDAPATAVATKTTAMQPTVALHEGGSDATHSSLFARRELWFGLAAAGTVALVATQDQWLTSEALESRSSAGEHSLANDVRPLGDGGVVFSALAIGYVGARFTGHPAAASQIMRIGASVGVAGLFTAALKEAVGRTRPAQTPGDADELHPFSGHDSFPSGHTTVAFALASAIDAETESRWVPWIAYPAAALVGWSRVHDNRHWASDVLAGAVIGATVAGKTDRFLQARAHSRALGLELESWNHRPELALTFRP